MAVIEIAKIQVRRGDARVTGLPTLDSGEFGWAVAGTDPSATTPELYIGNGTPAEGATVRGITKILTEHDLTDPNLFNFSLVPYKYLSQEEATTATHRSIATFPSTILRPYFNKFDDFTTIYDFGGINDGSDNTAALQGAIMDLWGNIDNQTLTSEIPRYRVALRIPAGVYSISGTLILPPYTTLIGDGQDKTIIRLIASNIPLIQTQDVYGNVFAEGLTNLNSGSIPGINLVGITFEYDHVYGETNPIPSDYPLLNIDCVIDSKIIDCKFNGYRTVGGASHNTNYTAINIRGQGTTAPTTNLVISGCAFDGLVNAITSDYDIQDVTIENSIFRNLSRGIVAAQTVRSGNQTGPIRTKIQNNNFYNIENEAIAFFKNTSYNDVPVYNTSLNNTFTAVGNGDGTSGETHPSSAVILFETQGNKSIGDHFDRLKTVNESGSSNFGELIQGVVYQEDTSVIVTDIALGSQNLTNFPISSNATLTGIANQAIKLQYAIRKGSSGSGVSRTGELLVNVSHSDAGSPGVSITDNYSYTGINNGLLDFTATANTVTNTISVGYTSGSADGTISYKYNQLH